MSSKRATVLMGILTVVVLAACGAYIAERFAEPPPPAGPQPLAGKNSVTLSVAKDETGRWAATYEYFYTGVPAGAKISLYKVQYSEAPDSPATPALVSSMPAMKGKQKDTFHLDHRVLDPIRITKEVEVRMEAATAVVASQSISQRIEWAPAWQVELDIRLAESDADHNLTQVITMIDSGERHDIPKIKYILERLIQKYPKLDQPYVEMARTAMRSNWGPEGLRHAETLIGTALEINPQSSNAKILLGYVYAHQKRHKEAEALFAEVSKAPTENLYLWVNWGESLQMQGRDDAAVEKFKLAIANPPRKNTYDHARRSAMIRLMPLLEKRGDVAGQDALHAQRTADYPQSECYGIYYAQFKLDQGDAAAARVLADKAEQGGCGNIGETRVLRGVAEYLAWAAAPAELKADALRQARLTLAAGPTLYYRLAHSDRNLAALKQVLATGESIDQLDQSQMTALATALRGSDLAVARRLLRMGAKAEALVGPEQMPAAFIPLATRDTSAIRLLRKAGVDFAKLKFRGVSAVEVARSLQDPRLMEALAEGKGASL